MRGSRQHIESELPFGNFVDLRSFRQKLPPAYGTCSLWVHSIHNVLSKLFMCIQVTYSIRSRQFKSKRDFQRTSLEGNLAHPAFLKSPRHSRTFCCVWRQEIDKDHEKQGLWAGLFSISTLHLFAWLGSFFQDSADSSFCLSLDLDLDPTSLLTT